MKKILCVCLFLVMLTGCKTQTGIKLDTIVDIPMNPTQTVTVPVMEPTEETTIPATEPTEAPTEKPKSTGGSKKKPSGNSGGSKQPAATEAPTQKPTETPTQPKPYDPSGYTPSSLDRGVVEQINAQRQGEGLDSLTLDKELCAIASVRARELAVKWSHTRPNGKDGLTVLREYGYSYSAAAENLYFGTGSASAIVSKWMSADAQKNNILMDAAAIGVGSYQAPDGLTYLAMLIVG